MQTKKRLIVSMPHKLYIAFKKFSLKSGLTKTKLLKEWIKGVRKLQLTSSYSSGKNTTVNFEFDADTINLIEFYSLYYGISKSLFVRLVISDNIDLGKSELNNRLSLPGLSVLLKNGKFEEIIYYLGDDYEKLSFDQLYIYILSSREVSKISPKEALNSLIQMGKNNPSHLQKALLIKTELLLTKRKLSEAIELIKVIEKMPKPTDKFVEGHYHYVKALCHFVQEQTKLAIVEYTNSLSYFSENPNYFISAWSQLFHLYARSEQYNICEENYNSISSKVLASGNLYAIARLHTAKGWLDMRKPQPDTKSAIQHFLQSEHLQNNIGHISHDQTTGLASAYLVSNDLENAQKYSELANSIESRYRGESYFGFSYLIKMLSSKNAVPAVKYGDIKLQGVAVQKTAKEYLIHVSQYLYGDTKQKELGISNLKRISKEGSYPQIKHASLRALNKNSLAAYSV